MGEPWGQGGDPCPRGPHAEGTPRFFLLSHRNHRNTQKFSMRILGFRKRTKNRKERKFLRYGLNGLLATRKGANTNRTNRTNLFLLSHSAPACLACYQRDARNHRMQKPCGGEGSAELFWSRRNEGNNRNGSVMTPLVFLSRWARNYSN